MCLQWQGSTGQSKCVRDPRRLAVTSSCSASSVFSSELDCSKAADGDFATEWASSGEGVGSWIQLTFDTAYRVSMLEYTNRYNGYEANRDLRLDFSDGTSTTVRVPLQGTEPVYFPATTTTWIKLTVLTAYATINNGAVEIQLWTDPVEQIATIVSCSASSEFSSDWGCSYAHDGIFERTSEWATSGEGVGSWIQLNFDSSYTVHMIRYCNREDYREANKNLRLEFSDGSTTDLTVPQEGCGSTYFQATTTTFARIVVESVYTTVNNGAQEIEFWTTLGPTAQPTPSSTQPQLLTMQPSSLPSILPLPQPSPLPTIQPTLAHSSPPTTMPSIGPTVTPSAAPTFFPPSRGPDEAPTLTPIPIPRSAPSFYPSGGPTLRPSSSPTAGCEMRGWVFPPSQTSYFFKTAHTFVLPQTFTIETWIKPYSISSALAWMTHYDTGK